MTQKGPGGKCKKPVDRDILDKAVQLCFQGRTYCDEVIMKERALDSQNEISLFLVPCSFYGQCFLVLFP